MGKRELARKKAREETEKEIIFSSKMERRQGVRGERER